MHFTSPPPPPPPLVSPQRTRFTEWALLESDRISRPAATDGACHKLHIQHVPTTSYLYKFHKEIICTFKIFIWKLTRVWTVIDYWFMLLITMGPCKLVQNYQVSSAILLHYHTSKWQYLSYIIILVTWGTKWNQGLFVKRNSFDNYSVLTDDLQVPLWRTLASKSGTFLNFKSLLCLHTKERVFFELRP